MKNDERKAAVLTDLERQTLNEILMTVVWNGNHVEPKAFNPTPEQYKTTIDILNKLCEVRRNP